MFQVTSTIENTAHSLLTWEWTRRFLHWLIMSAGTVSECAFLIASLWVSINANVHPFVLLFISEDTTRHITELATTAYVALPECIVGLAVVVTLSHMRVWLYNRKDYRSLVWGVLYGIPTLIFLVLSLFTLGSAVASVTFQMPTPLVVTRALAGYGFAFVSLLYTQLGVPQERDRLAAKDDFIASLRRENEGNLSTLRHEKDTIIEQLRDENTRLTAVISQQKEELQRQNELLARSKTTEMELLKAMNKSSDGALEAYSAECQNWLKSGVKTVSIEEITRFTGHSKRKIANAILSGILQTAPRNKDLILVSSLMEWLKSTPPPTEKPEPTTAPLLHVVSR